MTWKQSRMDIGGITKGILYVLNAALNIMTKLWNIVVMMFRNSAQTAGKIWRGWSKMKIFTEKTFREQIDKIKYEQDRENYIRSRLDNLTEELHQLEWRLNALEGRCNPVPVAENNMEPRR